MAYKITVLLIMSSPIVFEESETAFALHPALLELVSYFY